MLWQGPENCNACQANYIEEITDEVVGSLVQMCVEACAPGTFHNISSGQCIRHCYENPETAMLEGREFQPPQI